MPPNLFEYLFAAPGPTGTFYRQLAPLLTIGFGSGLGISFVYYLISGMLFGSSPLRRLAVRVVLLTEYGRQRPWLIRRVSAPSRMGHSLLPLRPGHNRLSADIHPG